MNRDGRRILFPLLGAAALVLLIACGNLIAGGILAGIAAALLLSRVLKTFLFGVEPTDPATLIAVGLLFATLRCSPVGCRPDGP